MAVKREERLRQYLENSSLHVRWCFIIVFDSHMDDYTDVKVAACCWKLLSWQAQKKQNERTE